MCFPRRGSHDAFAKHRFETCDRHGDALRIEVAGAEQRLSLSSFLELTCLHAQPDDCRFKSCAFELCAHHVEHRALVRRRHCKRHVERAGLRIFQLEGKMQRAGAFAATLEIGTDACQQHAQREEDLRLIDGTTFAEDRGLDRNGAASWDEGPAIDAARQFVPACRRRAEAAHERSVRQSRQIAEPLDSK